MRVHEYADAAGMTSGDVLRAVEEVNKNANEGLEDGADVTVLIAATTAQSGLGDNEVALLNKELGIQLPGPSSSQDEVTRVDSIFGSTSSSSELVDTSAESKEVDEIFGSTLGSYTEKELPQNEYAVYMRRQRGKGPAEIKALQIANDESEAVKKVLQRFRVKSGDYNWRTRGS